jgi:thiamine biosynthesis lipoprotein
MPNRPAALIGVFLMVLSHVGTSSTAARLRPYTFNYENVLGTSLELKIGATSLPEAEESAAAALREIDRQAKILSAWDNESEFSRWTRTSGRPVRISQELFEVLELFDKWRDRTGGALDASAEGITRLWKIAEQQQRLPSPDELATAVRLVRQPHWRLDPKWHTATHVSRAPLALSSFTKSYIAGRAADAALAARDVGSVVVNIGGDLVVRGAWNESVDIADPKADAENGPPIARLTIHDRAVATSGNYRRGVEIGGRHYSHIVDPRTGMPSEEVISSTVVARDPADAGAMATAFSVLTPAESRQLAASVPGVEFLLVTKDGRRIRSRGWSALDGTASQATAARPRVASADTWDPSYELWVSVELASLGFRALRPYVAIWIEGPDKLSVRTLAVWFNKNRFLPELRAWYSASKLRSTPEIAHSISSATRSAGRYILKWDGRDDLGKPVKPGKYTVFIEAAREHGGYTLLHQEMDFSGVPKTIPLQGSTEVASASLDYRKITSQ